jgi:hypothetical protein
VVGLFVATAFGFFHFITGIAGIESERALGYWGIRYMPATRNSDVLYPLLGMICGIWWLMVGVGLRQKLLGLLLGGACTIAVVLSYSRGAWLAAFVGIAVLLLVARVSAVGITAILLGFMVIAGVGFGVATELSNLLNMDLADGLSARVTSIWNPSADSTSSNDIRADILMASIAASFQYPLGVGAGNYRYFINDPELGNAENALFTVLGEAGWFGAIALAWIIYRLLFASFSAIAWHAEAGASRVESRLIPASGLAVTSLVYFQFNHELNGIAAWLIIGATLWLSDTRSMER